MPHPEVAQVKRSRLHEAIDLRERLRMVGRVIPVARRKDY